MINGKEEDVMSKKNEVKTVALCASMGAWRLRRPNRVSKACAV